MAENMENDGGRRGSRWRIAAWSVAALILLIPLVAMQFGDEVNWTVSDFVFAGMPLLGVGIPFELVVRKTGKPIAPLSASRSLPRFSSSG